MRTVPTGKPGRPQKVLSEPILQEMLWQGWNINVSQAARALNIHRNTLKQYLQSYQIRGKEYSRLADEELDTLTEEFKKNHTMTGLSYL